MIKNTSIINMELDFAQSLLDGFNRHYKLFIESTKNAKLLFEKNKWSELQTLSKERIMFYDIRVKETIEFLKEKYDISKIDDETWQRIKLSYIGLLSNLKQPELAETFFNTVICKILHRSYFFNDFIFLRPALSTEYIDCDPYVYRSYYPSSVGLKGALNMIWEDMKINNKFENLSRDLKYLLKSFRQNLPSPLRKRPNHQIQILSSPFFRNKGAYIIGKVINGPEDYPFVVVILKRDNCEIYFDTVIFDVNLISILFSFSRAYFMVDLEVPSGYVNFLKGLLPRKPITELYNILGFQKHGKTLFYRDFLFHLKHSSDKFVIAPGIKGLVMLVFTLPSYPYVFKMIKDVISPPKNITSNQVKGKYLLVKQHDRVGRMADTLEFSDVALPKNRFNNELLDELNKLVPSNFEEDGDLIILKHLYVERRMIPLNIFLDNNSGSNAKKIVEDYGDAIKELAGANIFPGDMLHKNFGVTRDGRVVFYDYDEIVYMTDCDFKKIPEAKTIEQELASEPWYPVRENDIFPENFTPFLSGREHVSKFFMKKHSDLMDVAFWEEKKEKITSGIMEDVFPYPEKIRFCNYLKDLKEDK